MSDRTGWATKQERMQSVTRLHVRTGEMPWVFVGTRTLQTLAQGIGSPGGVRASKIFMRNVNTRLTICHDGYPRRL